MKKPILIISSKDDSHATIIEKKFIERGENVFRLDTERFARGEVVLTLSDSEPNTISQDESVVAIDSIRSVWFRRPEPLKIPIRKSRELAFAQKELQELLEQLYLLAPHARWISDVHALRRARRKYPQLQAAKALGFCVPRTCVTNSPDDARRFIRTCVGGVIYKTLSMPVIKNDDADPEMLILPTSLLRSESMKHLKVLHRTGGIFQEYVPKLYEIRVTVIGDEVFAARIDSQKASEEADRVDWRSSVSRGVTPVFAYDLPADVSSKCLKLVKDYGLLFGAIDLIRRPDGEYVFLELNPNGQWIWVEELTKQPLIESMLKLLSRES